MEGLSRHVITEEKLFLSLVVRTFKLLALLPDGCKEKKEWLGGLTRF